MNVVCIYSQALTRCAKAEAELPSLRKRVRWLICKRMTQKLHDLSLTLHPLHLSLSLFLTYTGSILHAASGRNGADRFQTAYDPSPEAHLFTVLWSNSGTAPTFNTREGRAFSAL
jgi:hypothetical protein